MNRSIIYKSRLQDPVDLSTNALQSYVHSSTAIESEAETEAIVTRPRNAKVDWPSYSFAYIAAIALLIYAIIAIAIIYIFPIEHVDVNLSSHHEVHYDLEMVLMEGFSRKKYPGRLISDYDADLASETAPISQSNHLRGLVLLN